MPRESVHDKGLRYLHERRVRITRVEHHRVHARIRGERDVYDASVKRNGRAWCSCPARVPRCAHLVALELIAGALTTVEAQPATEPAPPTTTPTATAVGSHPTGPRLPVRDAYKHARFHEARLHHDS